MTIFENLATKLVNSTKEEAIETLTVMNVSWRLVREDEEYFMLSHDLRDDRINLTIDDGIVTSATVG